MSVVGNQGRTFQALLAQLRPHWRRDRNLPARIQTLLTHNRSFGSRDRRLYRELIYATLRYLPWIEPLLDHEPDRAASLVAWLAYETRATVHFRAEFASGWPACPASVAAKSAIASQVLGIAEMPAVLPEWFRSHGPEAFAPQQTDALLARAPLWLRLASDQFAQVTEEFASRGWRWQRSPTLPSAVQLLDEADVTATSAYRAGLIEVQDLGSQLVLESAGISPSECWLDACAGAGGKTLQLSRLLGPAGSVEAFDVRHSALQELAARAARAATTNVTVLTRSPDREYDGVLVDAPCSGSGTWRRAPHLKWTTTDQQIAVAATTQRELLDQFSARVRRGGRLIYATCSLSHVENEDVVAGFLAHHADFGVEVAAQTFGATQTGTGLTFLPAAHDNDGFFVATLRRS